MKNGDLIGNKAQFWLAFCTLMASLTVFEMAIVHVALMNCVDKIRGRQESGPVQMTSEGQVRIVIMRIFISNNLFFFL